jgi:hypothetical protein
LQVTPISHRSLWFIYLNMTPLMIQESTNCASLAFCQLMKVILNFSLFQHLLTLFLTRRHDVRIRVPFSNPVRAPYPQPERYLRGLLGSHLHASNRHHHAQHQQEDEASSHQATWKDRRVARVRGL